MEDTKWYWRFAVVAMVSAQVCLAEETTIKIGLIGDSTVADQSGWGPAFASRFNGRVKVFNYAVNGSTLQSQSKRLDTLAALKPDYVLIQFGHNDQKRYNTDVYREHLSSYIERIRKAGGKPIIVSSVTRRSFDVNGKIASNLVKSEKVRYHGTLMDYAHAAQAVAEKMKVPFIDLHNLSIAFHNRIGVEESMTYNFKEGDTTHFNRKGGQAITDLILPELTKIAPELVTCLKEFKKEDAPKAAEMIEGNATDESAWHPLFNGKDLSGWTVQCKPKDQGKTFWQVDAGTILCDSLGRPDHDYCWLVSDKEYGDFELRLKFQAYTNSPGNSGIQFRSRYDKDDQGGWLNGPQVDIHPPASQSWRTGLIYDETRGEQRWVSPSLPNWRIDAEHKLAGHVFKTANEGDGWNDIVIIARGNHIKTIVNGVVCTDWDGAGTLDNAAHRAKNVGSKGHFALQLHVKDQLRIRFKDIAIRELDSRDASASKPITVSR